MKKLIIGAAALAGWWWWSNNTEDDSDRSPTTRRIGELDVPIDADPDIIVLQDAINVSEFWILQAAGDVAAMRMEMSLPGPEPEHDWFGGELAYTGRLDTATRLHLTKIKAVVGKIRPARHNATALLTGFGLMALMQTDMAVESDPVVLAGVLYPLEDALPVIGGAGYPPADNRTEQYWALYEAIGEAYYLAAGLH